MLSIFSHRCAYRKQVEELQTRFSAMEKLVAELKIQLECQQVEITALKAENAQLKIENAQLKSENVELKEKLAKYENPKDSSNSSIPPSKDPYRKKYPTKEKSGLPAGGQKGHPGHHHPWNHTPDEIIPLYPEICSNCKCNDFIQLPEYVEARQEINIPPIQAHIREYQTHEGLCQKCGKRSVGVFPEHVKGLVQMGPDVDSLVGYFKGLGHLSHGKIARFFQEILHISISTGGVQDCMKRLSNRVEPLYEQLIEYCKNQPVLHSDETSSKIQKQQIYIWTFVTQAVCVFVSDKSRGFKVIQRLFGDTFKGKWVSDRYAAQLKIIAFHQLCLAHLIRNFQYLIDCETSAWAKLCQSLLKYAIHVRNEAGGYWDPQEPAIKETILQISNQWDALFAEPPPTEKAQKLFKQLSKRKHQLFLFLECPDVPPTNNLAESALRSYAIQRRVNGGFKSDKGAKDHTILQSIIETARRQGKDILQVLSLKIPLILAS
jgi:transposase/regulator of replication initiation timing